jgi:hypothetical protein
VAPDEANTQRVLVREAGERPWKRVALTEAQAKGLPQIEGIDRRYKPERRFVKVEVEALGQGVVTGIVRDALDALLPEPLADVLARERCQREQERARLEQRGPEDGESRPGSRRRAEWSGSRSAGLPRSLRAAREADDGEGRQVNARPSAIQAPRERYVDIRELAVLMGVSVSTIKRFVAAGTPSETWGMSRTRRYQPSRCIACAQSRGRSRTIDRNRDCDNDAPEHDNRRE